MGWILGKSVINLKALPLSALSSNWTPFFFFFAALFITASIFGYLTLTWWLQPVGEPVNLPTASASLDANSRSAGWSI